MLVGFSRPRYHEDNTEGPTLVTEQRPRPTIYDVPHEMNFEQMRSLTPDAGRRCLLSWGIDFDSRAITLGMKIEEHWKPEVKELHRKNQEQSRLGLIAEFGERDIEGKVENFLAIDTKPMSVLTYHNTFFDQVRRAFVWVTIILRTGSADVRPAAPPAGVPRLFAQGFPLGPGALALDSRALFTK